MFRIKFLHGSSNTEGTQLLVIEWYKHMSPTTASMLQSMKYNLAHPIEYLRWWFRWNKPYFKKLQLSRIRWY